MRRRTDESGFTLIETVIALFVFTLLAAGSFSSVITISKMTGDNREREVATDLAAQATDAVRQIGDPFQVRSGSTTTTVSGRVYTTTRTAAWVSSSGSDVGCTGSANLLYKRITITVTWAGQLPTTLPVRSDTLLATQSNTTDSADGAIQVSVIDSTGAPLSGVNVTISQGGVPIASQPAATDSDGCSYATDIPAGVYSVAISRTASVDATQAATPSKTYSVAAGSTVAAQFQYDTTGTYTITHAANYTASTPLLPVDLRTTLLPVSASVLPVITSNAATTATAYPSAAGYVAIAGTPTTATGTSQCSSFDPGAWPAGTSGVTPVVAGTRFAAAAASPGGSATVKEKMGVFTVRASATGYLVATMTASSAVSGGNPGCTISTTYNFGNVLVNGTVTVALPFGAWTLSSTNSSGTATTVLTSATTLTNAVPSTTTASSGKVAVLLDPRTTS